MTLRAVLEILFMYLCPHWDGRCWNHARCVCSKKKHASAPFIQRRAEHAGLFKSTFAAWYLQILVHIAIWSWCYDLLLINSSKLWQIPWHSALNCQFRFYDWIPRFRPRFLHRGNHRALIIQSALQSCISMLMTCQLWPSADENRER